MIIFEVKINNRSPFSVGINESGAFSAVLSAVRDARKRTKISFEIGGMIIKANGYKEFVRWYQSCLKSGDSITFRVRHGEKSDRPIQRKTESPATAEAAKKKYVLNVAKELKRKT